MGCVGILGKDGQLPTKEGKANPLSRRTQELRFSPSLRGRIVLPTACEQDVRNFRFWAGGPMAKWEGQPPALLSDEFGTQCAKSVYLKIGINTI